MRRNVRLLMIGLSASLLIVGIVVAQTLRSSTATSTSSKALVERVKQSSDLSVNFTNFSTVPLNIERATVTEISGSDYQVLTGKATSAAKVASFPNITLQNITDRHVTKLTIVIGNKNTGKASALTLNKISLKPQEVFTVHTSDWRAERSIQMVDNGDSAESIPKIADFDSDRMWLSGDASAEDLTVRLAMVGFDDGNMWLIDESSGYQSW